MEYGILIVCLGCALISFIIERLPRRKKGTIPGRINIVFYFLVYIFLVSLFQCVTGDINESFLNCFREATGHTYLKYCVLLLPCAAAVPIIFHKIFKQGVPVFMEHFISGFTVLFVTEYVFFVRSTTLVLCIQILAGVGYGVAALLRRQEPYQEGIEVRKKLGMILPGILWAGVTYVLYIPNQFVLLNLPEVPIRYASLLWFSVGMFIVFCAVCCAVGVLLPAPYARCYSLLFFGLTACGYIQYNFLNREMAMLDGDRVSLSAGTIRGNYAVWLGILLAVCAAALLLRKRTFAWYKYISCLFCLTQAIALIAALCTSDYSVQRAEILTKQHIDEFAQKENIVLFILDRYDEQYMDLVLKDDPKFLEPLSDFTHYRNAVSEYGHTYMALPYMLSGVEWEDKMPVEEYYSRANENAFFLERANALGYEVDVYTDSIFIQQNIGKNIRNWNSQLKLQGSLTDMAALWNKISRYSTLPYGMRDDFYYSTYDLEMVIKESGKYIWGDDTVIYRSIADHGISVDKNTDKLFKIIHMYGAHSPYYMNEQFEYLPDESSTLQEQSRASMKIVYNYIEGMKEKGIYDDAAIIITADHGQSSMHDPEFLRENGFDYVSVPILFVKEAGEQHEVLQTSKAPVTVHEMIPTLLRSMGDPSYSEYGRCYEEIPEDENRIRYFHWGYPPGIPYMTFQIDGDAREESSWEIVESEIEIQ